MKQRSQKNAIRAVKPGHLKGLVERSPFRPFTIRLKNGTSYQFDSLRDIHLTRGGRKLAWFGPGDDMATIFVEDITDIQE